jgi:hypothetical protein
MPHSFLCLVTILLTWGPQNCFMMEDPMDDPSKFSPLPVLLTLYNTFSSSSPFGLDFSEENSDQENVEKAQVLTVLENWSAALQKSLAKARNFQSPSAKSLYLENHVKYVVLPKSDFQSALRECALSHQGYLPVDISQLQSAINFESIPDEIFLNPKALFPNEDVSENNKKFKTHQNYCSIWKKRGDYGNPEVVDGKPCTKLLDSICLFGAGSQTYQNKIMVDQVQKGIDVIGQQIIYLLSQLKKYPDTHPKIVSDKVQHLVDGFSHYGDFVEDYINKGKFNFSILFSLQHCLHMVNLALHRSQHSDFWYSQTRQQKNFDSIKVYTDEMNDVLKSFQRALQNISCPMSEPSPPPNWSPDSRQHFYNANETTTFPSDSDDFFTTSISPTTVGSNDHQDGDGGSDQNNGDDGSGMAEQDDDGHDDGTNNDGDQPPSYQQIFINWLFGPSNQSRPHSNSSESDSIDDDLSSDEGNDHWISKVYKDWKMVKIWPFSYLIPLALYHLLSVIEFYINLLWKIASLFLFVYVYILANRLANVQNKQKECCCKCKQTECEEPRFDKIEIVAQAVNAQVKKEQFTRSDLRNNPETRPLVKRKGF